MPLEIAYNSEAFPPSGPVRNGSADLQFDWDDLLWAAVTVGRPNRNYVFRHGDSSRFEALFRWSLTRMALESQGSLTRRLKRTDAAKSLDPSEKGSVNYFLGMTMCKLFATKLLQAPWMLHLDVFRPFLNPVLNGRSRPDLVGETNNHEWVVLESKGRASSPNEDAKDKAKRQAERLVSVNGVAPTWHIGAITYFRKDVLQFIWCDPQPDEPSNGFNVQMNDELWQFYYAPVFELVSSQSDAKWSASGDVVMTSVENLDIQVEIESETYKYLSDGKWGDAKRHCEDQGGQLKKNGFQPDGIRVIAGKTWLDATSGSSAE